ncbi:MAG TPA: FAD:protein FMN transferase [Solirubrobacteraceae bacterium]|nr:FAD:protein FMN transferase [Solirubrobacteraceae bacterium]
MALALSTCGESRWVALGSSVVLRVTDPSALGRARAIVERELEQIDRACSRFREDSDLQAVNAGAGRFIPAGPLLIEALLVALRAAELTGGDVDPTVGNALVLAGYDRDWRLLGKPGVGLEQAGWPAVRARVTPGWRAIEVDHEAVAIRIPRGVRLDLGATAKAWAADRAADAVYEATGVGSLVSLGGDIATAGAAPEDGWRIYVTEDHRDGLNGDGQLVAISSGGLATSSTTTRRWEKDGKINHHIIDPATGVPVASVWRTASVAAATCVDANIASTAALVRGSGCLEWLAGCGLPSRLVAHDGRVVAVGDWPGVSQCRPRVVAA